MMGLIGRVIRDHPERTSEVRGGGGQPKVDELGQGEGGSGQSGRPFYLMWQG